MEVDEATFGMQLSKNFSRVKLWKSVRKKQIRLALCEVLQVNLEELIVGVTIEAVIKL